MINKLDYNNEAVLDILNNPNYTDDQKKELFEKYKKELQKKRKDEIVSRLNDLARDIPTITKEDYIECLKKYENDDLTKPFEVIEEELKAFEQENKGKYEEYLKTKEPVKEEVIQDEPEIDDVLEENNLEEIVPDVKPVADTPVEPVDEFDDTLFKDPEEFKQDITPSTFIDNNEVSVLNEEPETLAKPLFEESDDKSKDVMPEELPDTLDEKGNASAIILSIIAIIIGVVVMYSIIRLK
jgi:hypothetical protein